MVGALLRWLVFAGIFCGFYDGAGRTVVAPKTETCEVTGADNLQKARLEVVVPLQIGESCHHTAPPSRVQGSITYPSGNVEFSNCSNGSHNMDMPLLPYPNEAGGVSLCELCETLETGRGGSKSKIQESKIQTEGQRKSASEEPKFDKWKWERGQAVEEPTEEEVDVTEVLEEAVQEDAYMMQDADMEEVEATRAREEGCIGSISGRSQTYFTHEGAFQSSQAERGGEEINEPWNWPCDIWQRFSCGMRDDATHKSVSCKNGSHDRTACWKGEIPCPSDFWCIIPGRQLNGPHTTVQLEEVGDGVRKSSLVNSQGRVKGTKRVSFDDQVLVIPIEASIVEKSIHNSEVSVSIHSALDASHFEHEVAGDDQDSDGFHSDQFWRDFDKAWQHVLAPQMYPASLLSDNESVTDTFHLAKV